jgi:ribonuclease Z
MEQLHDLALKLERFKDNPSLSLIIYICPIHIYEGEEFREIQSAFPSTVHQAWINDGNNQLVYSSGAEVLATLNKIVHNDIFPVPFHETNEGPGIRALTKFHISGKNPVLLNTEDADLNVTNSNSTLSVTSTYNPSPKNPAITFLGTGAALPGKYRNVSATLVDFGDAAYLFDCGEGTAGQLWRRFGPQNCPRILQRLEGVLLSHLHADHHLGLPDVLGMVGKRLNIVAPERYKVFLTELGECADLLNSHDTFHSERLYEEADYQEEVSTILKLGKIVTVPVIHCPRSFGFVLHHKSGTRIVYSGDTRPCPALIESGRGSDILIHEATFADSLTTEAIERRHCTISEAITVGQSMQVSFTLLTHISQRHSKSLPPYDWNIVDRVLPVMDFMTVSLDQLKSMNFKELISSMLTNLPSDNDDQVQEDDQGNRHE